MNKLLATLIAGLFLVGVNSAFSADAAAPHGKKGHHAKQHTEMHQNDEHDITVGNEKAASSGSTSEDKTVKEEMTHGEHGKGHEKHGKGHMKQ